MSGFISSAGNPLSKLTVASLQDLGYEVDLEAAEPYVLPNLLQLAEAGAFADVVEHPHPHTLPVIPITLPADSLDV